MSEIAGNIRTVRHEAAATPAQRARRFLLQPAALGLLLALLAVVLLGRWFAHQANAELTAQTQGRVAILEASALAESVAGLVTVRQRPQTARGVTFVTLEDESGHVNVVVWRGLAERRNAALVGARLMEVRGALQRGDGGVTHVVARELIDRSALLGALQVGSHDFH